MSLVGGLLAWLCAEFVLMMHLVAGLFSGLVWWLGVCGGLVGFGVVIASLDTCMVVWFKGR